MKLQSFEFLFYGLIGGVMGFLLGVGSFFIIAIASFGGMTSNGRITSYVLLGVVAFAAISPSLFVNLKKFENTKSKGLAFRDFFLTLAVTVACFITIPLFMWWR